MATTWTITQVVRNMFDAEHHAARDPEARYNLYAVRTPDGRSMDDSVLYGEMLQPLMQHFGVEHTRDLVGKSFESIQEYLPFALQMFRAECITGKKSEELSAEQIRELIIKALARMECPDMQLYDPVAVADAFGNIWYEDPPGYIPWLDEATKKIAEISGNTVRLEPANMNEFRSLQHGPCLYMKLVSGDKVQKLTIAPSSVPVDFVD